MKSSAGRNDNFIEKVIQTAVTNFKSGNENNKILTEAANTRQLPNGKGILANAATGYLQRKENHFTYYSVSKIQESNFIAAAGPKSAAIPTNISANMVNESVEDLIDDTLFNDKFPIANIIALGMNISREKAKKVDFWDYCTQSEKTQIGKYDVNPLIRDYSHRTIHSDPKGMVKSTLTVSKGKSQKELNVTFIFLRDNAAIDLSDDRIKEELWQQYQLSKTQKILVHCASGVGRTGHLILTLEILKNYDKIFAGNDVQASAREIHSILNRIRVNRPALVNTKDQFKAAIKNAHILHQHALEKKYISSSKKSPELLFIDELEEYVKNREKGGTYASCWKIFSTFDKSTKISAANKMISLLKTGKIETAFTSKEIEALRDSKLGKIIAQHEDQLPECFKTAERDKIIAENVQPVVECRARM